MTAALANIFENSLVTSALATGIAATGSITTSGNPVACYVTCENTATVTGVTDTKGNAYSKIDDFVDAVDGQRVTSWVGSGGSGTGSNTITALFSATVNFTGIQGGEVTGSGGYDAGVHNGQVQATPTTTTDAVSSLTATPSTQPGLLVALSSNTSGAAAPAAGTGFTDGGTGWVQAGPSRLESKRYTALTAIAGTFTAGSNSAHTTLSLFFKEAGASGGAVLACTAIAQATVTPALTTQINLANTATAVASVTASMKAQLSANATAAATATPALTTQIKLAAAAQAVATVTANANSGQLLVATAAAVASATPALTTSIRPATSAQAIATGSAALTTAIKLAAAGTSVAAISTALTNWTTVTLAGTLYTGVGGILDPHFWVDAVPAVGNTIYYDATYITIATDGQISSSNPECRAVVQFNNGSGFAVGVVIITQGMVTYPAGAASGSAALTTQILLADNAAAVASATAALTTGISAAVAAQAVATVTPNLTTQIRLAAAAQASASISAGFGGAPAVLANTAAAVATGSAALTTQIVLAATASAVPSVGAPLTTQIRLAATPVNVATLVAGITAQIQLAATALAVASAVPQLAGTSAPLAATAAALASGTAALTTAIRLAASASAQASITTSLIGSANALAAAATSVASSTASLLTQTQFAANAAAVASGAGVLTGIAQALVANGAALGVVTAALSTQIKLAAAAQSNATIAAQLFGTASNLQAAAVAISGATATLTGSPAILIAQAAAQATVSAAVSNAGAPLAIAAQLSAVVSAYLTTHIQLAATAQAVASASGNMDAGLVMLPPISDRTVEFTQQYFAWSFPFKDPDETLDYATVFASLLPSGSVPNTWAVTLESSNPPESPIALTLGNKMLASSGEIEGINDAIYFWIQQGGTLETTYVLRFDIVDTQGRSFVRRVKLTVDKR